VESAAILVCKRCKGEKPPNEFPANDRKRNGRSSWCRECHNEATAAWRGRNPERIAAYNASRRVDSLPGW
jgi:hypothetical protein